MHLVAIKKYHRIVYRLEDGKGVDLNATNNEGFITTDFYCQEKSLVLDYWTTVFPFCPALLIPECIYALLLHKF